MPAAPDPVATASAQGGANRDTAMTQAAMNMVDQVGPDGSLTYSKTGDQTFTDSLTGQTYNVPKYMATTTLSDSGQRVQDINNQTEENIATIGRDQSSRIGGILGTPISFSGVSKLPDASSYMPNDYSADRDKVEGALLGRMNPQIERDRSSMEAKLTNQGLRPGSQAWNDAVAEIGRNANDARYGAILGAGQEQTRLLNERDPALPVLCMSGHMEWEAADGDAADAPWGPDRLLAKPFAFTELLERVRAALTAASAP